MEQEPYRFLQNQTLVDKGAEDKIIELAEGTQESLELGWVVVRKLGQKDLQDSPKNRDVEEEIFSNSSPWDRISSDNCGIEALRTRLQALLACNVRREFPSVSSSPSTGIRSLTSKWVTGAVWSLEASQRMQKGSWKPRGRAWIPRAKEKISARHCFKVSAYHHITDNALHTNYESQDALDEEADLWLATLVATRSAQFSDDFPSQGHLYCFMSHGHDDDWKSTEHHSDFPTELCRSLYWHGSWRSRRRTRRAWLRPQQKSG